MLRARAERVLYAVRTRNEIEPVLRELKRFGVKFSFLYSARRMCPLLRGDGGAPPPDEFWENCRLARLRGICPYYERLVELGDVASFVRGVVERHAPSATRIVEELVKAGLCPFFALKTIVDDVEFIVVTYPYVFKRDIFESVFEPREYSDYVLVVDEAHSLMDAGSMLEERLRRRDIEAFRYEIEKYAAGDEAALEVAEKLSRLFSRLKPPREGRLRRIEKRRLIEVIGDPSTLADIAAEIRVEKFREALGAGGFARIRVAASRVAAFALLAAMDGVEVFVSVGKTGEPELVALPVDHCIVTREPLNTAKAVILMSGTLPPEQFMRDVLCIERSAASIDTELLYGSNLSGKYYSIVTVELTSRYGERGGEMYKLYASYIRAVAERLRGVLLVVAPSYEFLSSIARRLDFEPLVKEDRDTSIEEIREKVTKLLEENSTIVLMAVAGGKLVEGVELTKDSKSLITGVFLAGVPYPQPDDYTRAVLERLSSKTGRERAEYYVFTVTAYVKARQALGRAIRGEKDRAIFVLGDRRYLSRRMRELLRIKYHRITHDIDGFREAVEEGLRRLWGSKLLQDRVIEAR